MPGPGAYVVGKEEREEANEVLATGYFSRYGDPKNPEFKQKVFTLEKEFASYCGVKYCIATSSGTASLFICLLALGIKPGDEVIVPGFTFVASYSAVIFAGAIPVLMEHILSYFREIGREYKKESLPKTDEILKRSVNISVGVVDPGIGSGFGIKLNSSDEEIEKAASSIRKAVL